MLGSASKNQAPYSKLCKTSSIDTHPPKYVSYTEFLYSNFSLICCLLCTMLLRLFVSIPLWWVQDKEEEKWGFVGFSCVTHTMCAHTQLLCTYANKHSYMHTRVLLISNVYITYTHIDTLSFRTLTTCNLSLILSLCFCFPFPCLGKKVNANRNSGIQRKTHSRRLRKQEQGIFLEEEGHLCAEAFAHRYFARRKETALSMWMCYMYMGVCVCAHCVVSYADWWTERSFFRGSLGSQVWWPWITHCERRCRSSTVPNFQMFVHSKVAQSLVLCSHFLCVQFYCPCFHKQFQLWGFFFFESLLVYYVSELSSKCTYK